MPADDVETATSLANPLIEESQFRKLSYRGYKKRWTAWVEMSYINLMENKTKEWDS